MSKRLKELWGDEHQDGSREACNAALADCIAGRDGACDLFFRRLCKRLREKVTQYLSKHGLPDNEARQLVVQKLEDMVLLARQGKLEVRKRYTPYLIGACENALRDQARLKKGHELAETDLSLSGRVTLQMLEEEVALSFLCFIVRLQDPAAIAEERDLLRKVGQQLGYLTRPVRTVIAAAREGSSSLEIAQDVERAISTVKTQWCDGVDDLCRLIQKDFSPPPPRPVEEFVYPIPKTPSGRRVLELIQHQEEPIAIPLEMIHFEGKTLEDVQSRLAEGPAAVEGLLLTGYRIVRKTTGCRFPEELLHRLCGHPVYPMHRVPFEYW